MTDAHRTTEAVIIHDELLNELIEIFHARGFNHRMPEDAVVRKRDQRTYHALRELRRTRGLQRLRIAPEPTGFASEPTGSAAKPTGFGAEPSVEQRKPDGYAFRYPDGFIRFSGGTRYNGDEPTETIPYYFGSPAPEPRELRKAVEEFIHVAQSTIGRMKVRANAGNAGECHGDIARLFVATEELMKAHGGYEIPPELSPTKGAELRDCICSDPENCREPVPGRRCKAGLSVNGALKHE